MVNMSINLHIKECENKFERAIQSYAELKLTLENNNELSLTKISFLLGKSISYSSNKIQEYNKCENEILGTQKIDYFRKYKDVTNANFIIKIKNMIEQTYTNPLLPLLSDKELIMIFNTSNLIVDKYITYILNNSSKIKYISKLPENIIEIIK